jgi:malonyl-CoA O-methyltransferase
VEEGYERWARTYDTAPNPLLALEERYVEGTIPDLAGKTVLDLACGTGRWLSKLVSRRARAIVGVDLSSAMLGVAHENSEIHDCLVRADCLRLPFRAGTFDFVLCSFALNHVYNVDLMARELSRTMKSGAQLLISEMHPVAHARGWRTAFRDALSAVKIETVSHPTENVMNSFRVNGFSCKRVRDLFFGKPEQPIFLRAGKNRIFARACQIPAVQIYEFKSESCIS